MTNDIEKAARVIAASINNLVEATRNNTKAQSATAAMLRDIRDELRDMANADPLEQMESILRAGSEAIDRMATEPDETGERLHDPVLDAELQEREAAGRAAREQERLRIMQETAERVASIEQRLNTPPQLEYHGTEPQDDAQPVTIQTPGAERVDAFGNRVQVTYLDNGEAIWFVPRENGPVTAYTLRPVPVGESEFASFFVDNETGERIYTYQKPHWTENDPDRGKAPSTWVSVKDANATGGQPLQNPETAPDETYGGETFMDDYGNRHPVESKAVKAEQDEQTGLPKQHYALTAPPEDYEPLPDSEQWRLQ